MLVKQTDTQEWVLKLSCWPFYSRLPEYIFVHVVSSRETRPGAGHSEFQIATDKTVKHSMRIATKSKPTKPPGAS